MENYNNRHIEKDYTIHIDYMVYQKIMRWVDKAVGEVSGLGKLTIDKDSKIITINSAILLKQENTAASTEIDPSAINKAMFELRNEEGHLNFWWHSHVNMDVFWSSTDIETIKQIGDQGFVVSTVFNKKREVLSSLYRKGDDLFPATFIDNIETQVLENTLPSDLVESWDKDFEEKCKAKFFEPAKTDWYKDYRNEYAGGHQYNWYNNYGNATPEQKYGFDFQDDIPVANLEAKIFAITPELEELKLEMLNQSDKNKARKFLHQICHKINKLKLQDAIASYNLKKPYLDAFNNMNERNYNGLS